MRHVDEISLSDTLNGLVSYQIRLVQIAAYKSFEREVAGYGTAPRYYGMLKIVETNPGISQTRLAEAIYLDRSSLVPILAALSREGVIERKSASGDRRVRRVFLTPQGLTLVQQLDTEVAKHEARMTTGLSESDRETLLKLLRHVDANLRAAWPEARPEDPAL